MLRWLYTKALFRYPRAILTALFVLTIYMGYEASHLGIDASADTLILDDDKDLAYTRSVAARYESSSILVLTYRPDLYLLSDESLENITALVSDLKEIGIVASTTSILNVPLLQSPPKPIAELLKKIPSIGEGDANLTLAAKEFSSNPLYVANLVSSDLKTTAIVLHLGDLVGSKDEKRELMRQGIENIRAVMLKYNGSAELFLGGLDMIASDMIEYIKSDLSTYSAVVLMLMLLVLWVIFKELRWVILPILISAIAISITLGVITIFGWQITVISSNFIALQLILTISIVIHLIVRYRELSIDESADGYELALHSALSMSKPTFFAVITTMAGFASLMLSGIKPIIALGWMMSIGLSISFVVAYILFPAAMLLLGRCNYSSTFESNFTLTYIAAKFVQKHGLVIIIASIIVVVFSLLGASKLLVENSFVNYFKKSTHIYQGMIVIDRELGGTTPLDVTIDLPTQLLKDVEDDLQDDEFDEFDEFEDEFKQGVDDNQYWFSDERMQIVKDVHAYLQTLDGVGKVLSLATMLEVGKSLNNKEDLSSFELALFYRELPDSFAKIILNPYLDIDNNQVRFAMRIVDSDPTLRRNELITKIREDLTQKLNIPESRVHLSGAMILYNNMLQSLYSSQISTLSAMALLLFVMFWVLFGSFRVALVAIVANLVPVGVIFGFMGFMKIPLDMMTITIAAISIGIAVDNTIHYLHRFKKELLIDGDYMRAMYSSHSSIGHAMSYTTIVITLGFLMLLLSLFIPTIYFGLLTVLAMLMAIAADLLLLPKLIILFKPFKKIS